AHAQLGRDRGLAPELQIDEAGLPDIQLVLVHREEGRTTAGQFEPVAIGPFETHVRVAVAPKDARGTLGLTALAGQQGDFGRDPRSDDLAHTPLTLARRTRDVSPCVATPRTSHSSLSRCDPALQLHFACCSLKFPLATSVDPQTYAPAWPW